MLSIKKSLYDELCKAMGKDSEFENLKEEVLSILHKKQKLEKKEVAKALLEMESNYTYLSKSVDGSIIQKSGYPVGTIREWKGQKYIKIAPNKWKPKYDSESKGAKSALTRLINQVENCKDVESLMKIVMENKQRFTDANGNHLPIVDKLRAAADWKNEELSGDEKTNIYGVGENQIREKDKYAGTKSKIKKEEAQLHKVSRKLSQIPTTELKQRKEKLERWINNKTRSKRDSLNNTIFRDSYQKELDGINEELENRKANKKNDSLSSGKDNNVASKKEPKTAEKKTEGNKYSLDDVKQILQRKNKDEFIKMMNLQPELPSGKKYYVDRIAQNIIDTYGKDSKEFDYLLENIEPYNRTGDTFNLYAIKDGKVKEFEQIEKDGIAFFKRNSKENSEFIKNGKIENINGDTFFITKPIPAPSEYFKLNFMNNEEISGRFKVLKDKNGLYIKDHNNNKTYLPDTKEFEAEKKEESEKDVKSTNSFNPQNSANEEKKFIGTFTNDGDGKFSMKSSKEIKKEFAQLQENVYKGYGRDFMTQIYYDGENLIATNGKSLKTIKVGKIDGLDNGFVKVDNNKDSISITKDVKERGKFPDYKRVIPDNNDNSIKLDNKVLKNKIESMKKDGAINPKIGKISLEIRDKQIFLDDMKVGEISNLTEFGSDILNMNYTHLLNAISGNESVLTFNSSSKRPFVISNEVSDNVFMPMDGNKVDYSANRGIKQESDNIKSKNIASNKLQLDAFMDSLDITPEKIEKIRSAIENADEKTIKRAYEDYIAADKQYNRKTGKILASSDYVGNRQGYMLYAMAKQDPNVLSKLEDAAAKFGIELKKSLLDVFEEYEEEVEKSVDNSKSLFDTDIQTTVKNALAGLGI